jgi:hypothetical protein
MSAVLSGGPSKKKLQPLKQRRFTRAVAAQQDGEVVDV